MALKTILSLLLLTIWAKHLLLAMTKKIIIFYVKIPYEIKVFAIIIMKSNDIPY